MRGALETTRNANLLFCDTVEEALQHVNGQYHSDADAAHQISHNHYNIDINVINHIEVNASQLYTNNNNSQHNSELDTNTCAGRPDETLR